MEDDTFSAAVPVGVNPGFRTQPEVPEDSAAGEIGQLYADIRSTTGMHSVNLVFRELAADGTLPKVWAILRPAYASGALLEAGSRLCQELGRPVHLPPLGREVVHASSMAPRDLRLLKSTLAHFHRANAINLVMVSLIATDDPMRSFNPAPARTAAPTPASTPAGGEILPLPKFLGESGPLIDAITTLLVPGGEELRPTVLRHLASWPVLLGAIWGLVASYASPLREAAAHAADAATREAAMYGPLVNGMDIPPAVRMRLVRRFRPVMSSFLVLTASLTVDANSTDGAIQPRTDPE